MLSRDQKWLDTCERLKAYILEHRHLPGKKKDDKENRPLLNWWKYNRKLLHAGKLSDERAILLNKVGDLRFEKQ